MALHPTIGLRLSTRIIEHRHITERRRDPHDLAPLVWRIAIPACLLFWAAVAYGIHSAV